MTRYGTVVMSRQSFILGHGNSKNNVSYLVISTLGHCYGSIQHNFDC